MKKPMKDRIGDFMAGKGFYIVLFLCVAAIGISGYVLFSSMNPAGPEAPVAGTVQVTVTPTPSVVPEKPEVPATAKPTPTPSTKPAPTATPAAAATPVPAPSASAAPSAPAVYTWPVKGEILSPFSVEALAYDETMGDWRTHAGIDISAAQGTKVLAAASGTVTAVNHDDLMGTSVVIDHGNGVVSTYANLASVPTVSAGDSVATGDVIGSVGNTAIAESALPTHLPLEMTKDGLPTAPPGVLPS